MFECYTNKNCMGLLVISRSSVKSECEKHTLTWFLMLILGRFLGYDMIIVSLMKYMDDWLM